MVAQANIIEKQKNIKIKITKTHLNLRSTRRKMVCYVCGKPWQFDINDLDDTDVILGIKIDKTSNNLEISQLHYIEKVLEGFSHLDCKLVSRPYDPSIKLRKSEKMKFNN